MHTELICQLLLNTIDHDLVDLSVSTLIQINIGWLKVFAIIESRI